jgi:hypothetical protein
MDTAKFFKLSFLFVLFISLLFLYKCTSTKKTVTEEPKEVLNINTTAGGQSFKFEFVKGEAHNHPTFAVWLEDEEGNYIQTIFITKAIATGIFDHGGVEDGKWVKGERRRPAALPVWSYTRGVVSNDGYYIPTSDNPVPDAYTSATPEAGFYLNTKADTALPEKYWVKVEVNQTWDWNEFWTNSKFPDDQEYKTSCQPALVYGVLVDAKNTKDVYVLKLLGRSHHSGIDGKLYDDLETITTAKHIFEKITLELN